MAQPTRQVTVVSMIAMPDSRPWSLYPFSQSYWHVPPVTPVQMVLPERSLVWLTVFGLHSFASHLPVENVPLDVQLTAPLAV